MSLALAGFGTAVPATRITQAEAMAIARALCCRTDEQATWLPGLYEQSGIDTRHLAFDPAVVRDLLDGTRHSGSPFLPAGAPDDRGPDRRPAHAPLRRARRPARRRGPPGRRWPAPACEPRDDHAPGHRLLHRLPRPGRGRRTSSRSWACRPTVQRTHVGFMGCHGALNGLRVARAFAEADPAARVLLCAVELCGLHYHYDWDPQKMVANALFADGAAAVVGVHGGGGPRRLPGASPPTGPASSPTARTR